MLRACSPGYCQACCLVGFASAISRKHLLWVGAGIFPRGPGQVLKLRAQIKEYVAGQLAACTQPCAEHPDEPFQVGTVTSSF